MNEWTTEHALNVSLITNVYMFCDLLSMLGVDMILATLYSSSIDQESNSIQKYFSQGNSITFELVLKCTLLSEKITS